jgi:hypothetical protein
MTITAALSVPMQMPTSDHQGAMAEGRITVEAIMNRAIDKNESRQNAQGCPTMAVPLAFLGCGGGDGDFDIRPLSLLQ